jgi:hypothetical protein
MRCRSEESLAMIGPGGFGEVQTDFGTLGATNVHPAPNNPDVQVGTFETASLSNSDMDPEMTTIPNAGSPANFPRGISSDFLIEPDYVHSLGWGLYCLGDRPTFRQLSCLMGTEMFNKRNIYGCFEVGPSKNVVSLESDARSISAFLAEMSGGDVCVYDLPNSFLMSVLEGDITILAGPTNRVVRCVGSSHMDRTAWVEIASGLRIDIKERILSKYVDTAP